MKTSILNSDAITCICACDEARLLVDARDYFLAFVESAKRAKKSIILAGWQFDTEVELIRGHDKEARPEPTKLVPFLNYLCEQNQDLHIYLLAWDYSSIYAIEREWLQRLKFDLKTHERVHFDYLTHPEAGGAFHQKYTIIDGHIAFVGGLDVCDARYDDPSHRPNNPQRTSVNGQECKPFHDLQLALLGEAAAQLTRYFAHDWQDSSGNPIARDLSALTKPSTFPFSLGLPIHSSQLALSRTLFAPEGDAPKEIRRLFERAIHHAERLIYVENQYFTSQAIFVALKDRLQDPERSKLTIVLVMPDGADTPKEDFALGDRQRAVQHALAKLATINGHELRLLKSVSRAENGEEVTTFIHSKLLIVDDELLVCGSANWTNRSMQVDIELNVSFEADLESRENSPLVADIREIRATLLAEHAGYSDPAPFRNMDTLIQSIDAACHAEQSKLVCQELKPTDGEDPLLSAFFDPRGPTTVESLEDALRQSFNVHDNLVKKTMRRFGQRLGVFDIDAE